MPSITCKQGVSGSSPLSGFQSPSQKTAIAASAREPRATNRPLLPQRNTLDTWIWRTLAATIVALIVGLLVTPRDAAARPHAWQTTTATWYGPGLYGNRTACGQRYTQRIRGVAIGRTRTGRYLAACGDAFVIRHRGRAVRVTVIDRCPGCVGERHRFDLSARTARDLCACVKPRTLTVRWRKARG
jgi:rare lipoprotein A (peptidoglycan hydrolase)